MPRDSAIKRVLVLGSGGIRIGQAGEFDYSGSQVLKALKEEDIYTILVNPNIATIQTDPELSDRVYLLPLTVEFVERVIQREHPDALMLSFGGQTALNLGVELQAKGILQKYGVRVLGTPVRAIEMTEDRELFRQAMMACDVEICKSAVAYNKEDAWKIAKKIGFPLIIRVGFTLGGQGSGIAKNEDEFNEIVDRALAQSMISQILVEECVAGWKEIEYEVVRDRNNNTITVCNMENFDPVGIHTGESIVIAPSQTLTNEEYQMLRTASIRAINHLGIIGECNIQYALHPTSKRFVAIEVNARLSRSSALASKATGYPLAYIAAKLALGYTLPELRNRVTNITTANFEPALDYVALKIPRWNMEKFKGVSRRIGTQMKSVGEVMGIGRNFEEAFQKAIRMLDIDLRGLIGNNNEEELMQMPMEKLEYELSHPTDIRYLLIPIGFKRGISLDRMYELTAIDKWFLSKILHLLDIEKMFQQSSMHTEDKIKTKLVRYAKTYGFSDGQIARYWKTDSHAIRRYRHKTGIQPMTKQIDTLAAEWPAQTNYLYMTYGGDSDDIDYAASITEFQQHPTNKKIIVLGSGVYRIGASVEFDWGCVNMAWALKNAGVKEVIMVNYNPETVSTDYDMSDKLYFEELSAERVLDICHKEYAYGLIVSVGGQIANNLVAQFMKYDRAFRTTGVLVLGTEAKNIDKAEDRNKFGQIMDQEKIKQPEWDKLQTPADALKFAQKVGYPVLVRPSYVLSGAAMRVASNEVELKDFLELAAVVSKDNPVVISKFFLNCREIECDGVGDGENVLVAAVVEHIENAGIHSGDATMSIPAPTLKYKIWERITYLTQRIARAMEVKGPFNIQYLVKDDEIYVIEMNLRSSRSMPYVSKAIGINLIKLAANVILGQKIPPELLRRPIPPYVLIKAPMFSFMRLEGADPILGVEMMSTGEVACVGENISDALIKSLLAAEYSIPLEPGKVLITVAGNELKQRVIPIAQKLHNLGHQIVATDSTAKILTENGIPSQVVYKVREVDKHPNIMDCILKRELSMIINIPIPTKNADNAHIFEDEYKIRRKAVEFNIPVLTNLQLAEAVAEALVDLREQGITDKKSYYEKVKVESLNEYHKLLKINYW
jgi:carbamoyl-phosphate synthase large subunit